MPSGSRISSGGSGNHGGFSSRGSSSFGSSRGGYGGSHRPRGPRYIRWFGHRTVIITTGRQNVISILSTLILFAFLFTITVFGTGPSIKQEIAMVEEEYRYYQGMITYAESHEDYQWEAVVTESEYSAEYGKYCIYYEFKTADGRTDVEGYTFFVYTYEELPRVGSKIQIAVNENPVATTTDSIPMDYKQTTLDDDAYYTYLIKTKNGNVIKGVVGILIIVALAGGIFAVVATAKKKEEEKIEAEKQEKIKEEKKKYCEYCGAKIQETDTTCSSCGARLDGRIK